jgi:hypothetical protein
MEDCVYASQLLFCHLVSLVQQYGIAELYLLDYKVGDIVLSQGLSGQVQSASELVF